MPKLLVMQVTPSSGGANQAQTVANDVSVDVARTAMSLAAKLADKLLSGLPGPSQGGNAAPVPSGSTYAVYA